MTERELGADDEYGSRSWAFTGNHIVVGVEKR